MAESAQSTSTASEKWLKAISVYTRPRVLIVMLLGFSAGLPLALVTSTLQAWLTQSGIDLKTIGLFSLVGLPYTIKFLWAPLVDALDVPLLSRALGRRRGWLARYSKHRMRKAIGEILDLCQSAERRSEILSNWPGTDAIFSGYLRIGQWRP